MKNKELDYLRVPPHSMEAEQAVLGGVMLDNEKWDSVSSKLVDSDFYSRAHRLVFQSIKSLSKNQKPLDLITITEDLENKNLLQDIGGFAYLSELAKNTPSAANIMAYAEIVQERAILRSLISIANEIASAGYEPEGRTAAELLDFAETKVFRIVEEKTAQTQAPENIENLLQITLDKIQAIIASGSGDVTGLSTGFDDLDSKTAGLQPGNLIIIAARPSMGKTTFAMNICENVSLSQDKPVLIFSLEMPAEQLMMRMLASLSLVDQTKIRTAKLEDHDWASITSTMGLLMQKKNIFIDDASGLTPSELRSKAKRLSREVGGLSMIMVDYLQLMRVPGIRDNRTQEISEISRSLKALAKELNVPVIALSQLNRSLEQRADKRPTNSDLRESGAIEQDADLILFIYRDEVYNQNSNFKGLAEIIIGKQRNGPIGSIGLSFKGHLSKFDNRN